VCAILLAKKSIRVPLATALRCQCLVDVSQSKQTVVTLNIAYAHYPIKAIAAT
jgi:hypothetical protein